MSPDGYMVICDVCGASIWVREVKPVNLCAEHSVPPPMDDVEPLPFTAPLNDELSIETWRVIGAVMADRETRRLRNTK